MSAKAPDFMSSAACSFAPTSFLSMYLHRAGRNSELQLFSRGLVHEIVTEACVRALLELGRLDTHRSSTERSAAEARC